MAIDLSLDPHAVASEEAANAFGLLSFDERRRIGKPSTFAALCIRAWEEHVATHDPRNPRRFREFRPFARWWFRNVLALELWTPALPLDSDFVVQLATSRARTIISRFAVTYGPELVEVGTEMGLAGECLFAMGRSQSERPRAIRDFWAYFASTAKRALGHEVRTNRRALRPGEHARFALLEKYVRKYKKTRPELSAGERRELAARDAAVAMKKIDAFVSRVWDEALVTEVPDVSDLAETVEGEILMDQLGRLVQGPPFNDTDRRAWRLFRQAGLCGRDIGWDTQGVAPHNGAQQLLTLLRKLRDVLQDWRERPTGR